MQTKNIKFNGTKVSFWARLFFPMFRQSVEYKVSFDEASKYIFENERSQYTVNRLFGLSAHTPKARSIQFVWSYHPQRESFLVDMLVYEDGKPHVQEVAELKAGQWVTLKISQHKIYVNGVDFDIFKPEEKGCGATFLPPKMHYAEHGNTASINFMKL